MNTTSLVPPSAPTRSRPVWAFLLTGVGGAYVVLGLLALVARGHLPGRDLPSRIGLDLEEFSSLALVLVLLASAVWSTHRTGGPAAVRELVARAVRWRVPASWFVVSVAALPATTVVLALVLGDRFRTPSWSTVAAEVGAATIAFLLINLWEETVWVGFMQTRLERRTRFFVAAFLTAIPFSLVHLPIRVITGEASSVSDLASQLLVLVVLTTVLRTLLGALGRAGRNSVLLPALAHTAFNRSNNVDGIAADLLVGQQRTLAALAATLFVTVAVVISLRRRLGRDERSRLDEAEGTGPARADLPASPADSVGTARRKSGR